MEKLIASVLDRFKNGELVADLNYTVDSVVSVTFRESWVWDSSETEPAFFTMDVENKRMAVYGLKQTDLEDKDVVSALMLSGLI